jgi:hypothetical protein
VKFWSKGSFVSLLFAVELSHFDVAQSWNKHPKNFALARYSVFVEEYIMRQKSQVKFYQNFRKMNISAL